VVEVWNAGRYATAAPRRQRREDRIEVWRDWKLIAAYTSTAEAQRLVDLHLAAAPVRLDDLRHYLAIRG
jgi:hypothetical protein